MRVFRELSTNWEYWEYWEYSRTACYDTRILDGVHCLSYPVYPAFGTRGQGNDNFAKKRESDLQFSKIML